MLKRARENSRITQDELSTIIILYGQPIPFFAIKHFPKNEAIMQQAHSLSVGTPIRVPNVSFDSQILWL